jgi:hypothetical protein
MIPKFAELPVLGETGERHAWDVWGREDELGSLNRIGPDQVRAASRLVRAGRIIPLTVPLTEPSPGLFPSRVPYSHQVEVNRGGRDDKLDDFYLQFSSQWDGLRHIRFREFGYWGGRSEEDLDTTGDLGIDRWAERGPIGRGVLVDVERYLRERGTPLPADRKFEVDPELLGEVAAAQGVDLREGDFLVMRTGWMEWYRGLSENARDALRGSVGSGLACPGLDAAARTVEFLWDTGIVGVAADNVACEALPVDRAKGFQHRRLIPLLGMAIGEFWWLSELSEHCARTGAYDFLLVSAALRVPRGVGSPANALALV